MIGNEVERAFEAQQRLLPLVLQFEGASPQVIALGIGFRPVHGSLQRSRERGEQLLRFRFAVIDDQVDGVGEDFFGVVRVRRRLGHEMPGELARRR